MVKRDGIRALLFIRYNDTMFYTLTVKKRSYGIVLDSKLYEWVEEKRKEEEEEEEEDEDEDEEAEGVLRIAFHNPEGIPLTRCRWRNTLSHLLPSRSHTEGVKERIHEWYNK